VTISRPAANGASVWSWQGRHRATRRSRSKSEPPRERLRTWWTSRLPRWPHAWQRQPARVRTSLRIACHSIRDTAGRRLEQGGSVAAAGAPLELYIRRSVPAKWPMAIDTSPVR